MKHCISLSKGWILLCVVPLSSCKVLTTIGQAVGVLPNDSGMNEAARIVDDAISNWVWGGIAAGGAAMAELSPLRPIGRTVAAVRRRKGGKVARSPVEGSNVGGSEIVEPGAS